MQKGPQVTEQTFPRSLLQLPYDPELWMRLCSALS